MPMVRDMSNYFTSILIGITICAQDLYIFLVNKFKSLRLYFLIWLWRMMPARDNIIYAEASDGDTNTVITPVIQWYYKYNSVLSAFMLSVWLDRFLLPNSIVYIIYQSRGQIRRIKLDIANRRELLSGREMYSVDLEEFEPNEENTL